MNDFLRLKAAGRAWESAQSEPQGWTTPRGEQTPEPAIRTALLRVRADEKASSVHTVLFPAVGRNSLTLAGWGTYCRIPYLNRTSGMSVRGSNKK